MGRPRKPYFRKSDGHWVSRFRGEYVKLAKGKENEAEAKKRFHELMALEAVDTPVESVDATTVSLCEAFLAWSHRENEPRTYEFYRSFLQTFVDLHGAVRVRDLKAYHVTRWFETQPGWNQSSRRCAVTAIKRALNWAVKEGYLGTNPLKAVEKPSVLHREKVVTAEEHKTITDAVLDEAFKWFLFSLRHTGCRPGEIRTVTAQDVNLDVGTWTFKRHKTVKKTHKPRVVMLTPPMIELCRQLVVKHPNGALFRNSRGKPWTRNAIRCRFRRLRHKLGVEPGVVAYAYRHTFTTEGLEAGVPIATMAELLGHTSTKMISDHYGHLDQKSDHLREAARRAAGPDGDA
jgi:integrase